VHILDLLLPPACAGCGNAGAVLCADCVATFERPSRATDRFVAPDAGVVIGEALNVAVAAFAYAGPIRRALAALKYVGASRTAPALAAAAAPVLGQLARLSGPAALVPIPVHRDRLRSRGYNQADLIARCLGDRTGLTIEHLLERTRPTTKQHRLDRAARLANLRDAFGVVATDTVPASVILVDDIITTAATLEACASVLRGAGVREVYGFAVAREV
jgi:ComF family protein